MKTRVWVVVVGALGLAACQFEPPTPPLQDLPIGAGCTAGPQCQSAQCRLGSGGVGRCVECTADLSCSAGSRCEVAEGRCVAAVPLPRHVPEAGGFERRNMEGRVHVGRVAVVPVNTPPGGPR